MVIYEEREEVLHVLLHVTFYMQTLKDIVHCVLH
jgi:hypothetical protein